MFVKHYIYIILSLTSYHQSMSCLTEKGHLIRYLRDKAKRGRYYYTANKHAFYEENKEELNRLAKILRSELTIQGTHIRHLRTIQTRPFSPSPPQNHN